MSSEQLEGLTDKQVYKIVNGLEHGNDSVNADGIKFILKTVTFKIPVPGLSGKEGAKDVPEWAKGNRPTVDEDGKDFAKRLMDEKYGPGEYEKGPGTEFSKIQKWGDRAFQNPGGTPNQ
jgi:hypothetical protein